MISLEKAIAGIIAVTLANGFFSTTMFNGYKDMYSDKIERLESENSELRDELSHYNKYGIEVDVTMYQPVYPQTDDTPNITADGTRIRISKASQYKFVALSRNLLKRWGGPFDYGDLILIKGTGRKDGVYHVRDTMNPKWVNVVDILESTHVEPYAYDNVNIFKLSWLQKEEDNT